MITEQDKENKQQFITLLDGHLRRYGCGTEHASADADLLIVQTAISTTEIGNKPTVLVADDTDILILLCYHWVRALRGVYSSSQNLAKLPRSNPGAGISQLSSQHWAQEYVITSFLYMPFSDVIQHHMYMALENQLHLS